jgi:hypothetical protein
MRPSVRMGENMILRDFIKVDHYYIFNPNDGTANRLKTKDMCMSGLFTVLDNGEV